ncbi:MULTISPECIES: hypothetical protein [unclassified Mesorhizobium]|uniref:hypothetical protein n=1 Tax=unclassified Mesorhizobium TaxID=325217 RepID=UPI000F76221C|nr:MULTISPECIES: hypothetical protein [unclassified Mesorhizobium]AZO04917.1 hypothetical protein EJ068_18890 [Mesorhizobium sp. M2A.F.Ca.ET.043.02.1.1]RUW37064.1 hypothetical protein EOA37_25905 [Mesorhizobium sp. M2A.F.Ca.ET.015.02.1.1]RVC95384.1 hypothetical protein EN739_13260 [Mesorhizobium sp. M2A.F.Ca.ET.017.03.2.1]RVD05744.1 hypothetical protein EN753_19325 [Mesorhizobium sp. M2A.F.Ca.ET.029.05.1.1]RWB41247.1 MAG: hypothetical protein EOQ46_21695 [Mesorhizobium sp.]
MISILSRLMLACLLLPCLWAAALAQDVSFPELSSAVGGRQDVTYLDLAKMVLPDLKAVANGFYDGSAPIDVRDILGGEEGGSPPETVNLPNAAVLAIKAGGKERLAMLFDLGQAQDSAEGFAVLALYDLTGKPKLLDAVNVGTDQSTYFRDPGKLAIGPGDDALITMSTHFNSNQGYVGTILILVRNDRFEPIDQINTFDENVCAYKRTQDLSFQTRGSEKPYAAVRVTVTDATKPSGESCEEPAPKAVSHDISVTYHWNKKTSRYVADSDAFKRLSAENEKRF